MEHIIEYIKKTYAPLSVIVYGSYADGSNNENSDFDALVISKNSREFHDVSFVEGIQLDVFVYPDSYFDDKTNYEEFVQIFDGKVILDTNECGTLLKRRVLEYMNTLPFKTSKEVRSDVEWCKKMLLRTERNDVEGLFRWHWVLTESLEIFCSIVKYPYRGPKQSLRWMEIQHPKAFQCYAEALAHFDTTTLRNWIDCLENMQEELENEEV